MASIIAQDLSFIREIKDPDYSHSPMARIWRNQNQVVIDHVNLEISHGDRVAVVGHNGAGKTTLLRLLAGIFKPDTGHIEVDGKVDCLLDSGFGLDPRLSGRDNARSRAILMGCRKGEIETYVDFCREFSELGKSFERITSTYSTGMLTRLVFSMSVYSTPDILLIDEGFGTADSSFAKKAVEKIKDLYSNTSILMLASHNQHLLLDVCNRALVLSNGKLAFDGGVEEALKFAATQSGSL
jgi:ABC-type polysaccharide/polyol phosphate transport system ATPase subunit